MIDTLILHTQKSQAYAGALAAAWRGKREPARACAQGGAPMAVGRHLLVVAVLGEPDAPEAEQQVVDTALDETLAAVLLVAPGRPAPRGAAEARLPVLVSTGEPESDIAMLDAELRELGRSVVFGGEARKVFGVIGRPRAPKLATPQRGKAPPPEEAWPAPEEAKPAPDPRKLRRQRSLGFALGIGLGLAAAGVVLAPWALSLLRHAAP